VRGQDHDPPDGCGPRRHRQIPPCRWPVCWRRARAWSRSAQPRRHVLSAGRASLGDRRCVWARDPLVLIADIQDRAGLEAFISSYLSPQNSENCADGCPSAALLDAIARRPAAGRQVFTDELMGLIGDIALRLLPTGVAAARMDALTAFGLIVGTLQLSRALADRSLSDQLLARGVETALKLPDDPA
jgi:hypothetical protein